MEKIKLTYSIADQNFEQTKSLGILNYSTQLPAYLARRPELETLTILSNRTLPQNLDFSPKAEIRYHDRAIAGKLFRIYWDQFGLYRAAVQSGNPWLFLPKGFASFLVRCPVSLASCVADVMWDHYGRNYPGGFSHFELVYFKQCFKATVRNSRIIFTISDFSTAEVKRVAREMNLVAPPVVTMGIGFTPPAIQQEERQNNVVVLASRFPHKKTRLALEFIDRWQRETEFDGRIIWVGQMPADLQPPTHPNWQMHKRLAEPEYRKLLGKARILVYFSDYEGFGMPPVEAALAGVCPVYSDVPAIREVMAGTGISFQNDAFESFAAGMKQALECSRESIEAWGRKLIGIHSWQRVTDRVMAGLLSVRELPERRTVTTESHGH